MWKSYGVTSRRRERSDLANQVRPPKYAVRTLTRKDYEPVLTEFVNRLRQRFGEKTVSIILYGSVARGKARPDSDIDLLVILDHASESYLERLEPVTSAMADLRNEKCWKDLWERGVSAEFNVLVFSREEADRNRYIYLDMIEEAQFLVDRDGFLQRRLSKLKKRLEELGARRVPINGRWYWDLKPDLKKGETIIL